VLKGKYLNKYLFLVNPIAGTGRALKSVPVIEKYLKEIGDTDSQIVLSKAPGHLTDIAKKSCLLDFTHFVAVGGDGTLNEVINGLGTNFNKLLALLPVGSGNDFARNLHLSKNVVSNLKLIFNPHPKIKMVNLTEVEIVTVSSSERHKTLFINSLGIGFDALVADLNQKNKRFNGLLSYVLSVIHAIGIYRDIEAEIFLNDGKFLGPKLLISIGNGCTSGGGFFLTPDAEIDDNLLDICIIDSLSKVNMLRHLPKALMNKIKRVKEVHLQKITKADIYLKKPFLVHADGEIISREAVKISIELSEKRINVISG